MPPSRTPSSRTLPRRRDGDRLTHLPPRSPAWVAVCSGAGPHRRTQVARARRGPAYAGPLLFAAAASMTGGLFDPLGTDRPDRSPCTFRPDGPGRRGGPPPGRFGDARRGGLRPGRWRSRSARRRRTDRASRGSAGASGACTRGGAPGGAECRSPTGSSRPGGRDPERRAHRPAAAPGVSRRRPDHRSARRSGASLSGLHAARRR